MLAHCASTAAVVTSAGLRQVKSGSQVSVSVPLLARSQSHPNATMDFTLFVIDIYCCFHHTSIHFNYVTRLRLCYFVNVFLSSCPLSFFLSYLREICIIPHLSFDVLFIELPLQAFKTLTLNIVCILEPHLVSPFLPVFSRIKQNDEKIFRSSSINN